MAPLNSRGSNFAKGGWFISFHCNYFGCLSLSFHSFINIHPGIHSIVFYWWAIQCTIPKGWEIAVEPLLTISRTSANCCVFISSAVPPVKSSAPHQPHRSTPHTNQTSNPNTMMIILTTLYTRNLWEVDLYNAVITVICCQVEKIMCGFILTQRYSLFTQLNAIEKNHFCQRSNCRSLIIVTPTIRVHFTCHLPAIYKEIEAALAVAPIHEHHF